MTRNTQANAEETTLRERVCVALPASDPLVRQDYVEWSELRARRFVVTDTARGEEVHDFIIQHLAEPGIKPRIDRHAVHRDMLLQIVASGSALTLINEAAAGLVVAGVAFRPIKGEEITSLSARRPTTIRQRARWSVLPGLSRRVQWIE